MSNKSKEISIFMIDGEPTSRIKCTMKNRLSVIYKIPRLMLDDCKDGNGDIVKHLKQTGIYFLVGENVESGNKTIYVGQAGIRKNGKGLYCRLLEHAKNENENYWSDWNEILAFTTQNDSFGPTEISYLENKFTNLAKEAGRYDVQNGNEPNQGNITEEKESELQDYIDEAKVMISVLGYKIFEPLIKVPTNKDIQKSISSPLFTFQGKYNANGIFTNEGFVLLKGSAINPNLNKSAHGFTIKAREKNKTKINSEYLTTEDILFTSPSAAAGFVGGSSLSGNAMWKTKDGKSPKDINL
jgi:hypothetical protein